MTWTEGTAELKAEAPWRLHVPRGLPAHAPLLVGLHGMGESEAVMVRRFRSLETRPVALLMPRAPWPFEVRRADRIRIGHAWYQYDGNETRFVESMDRAAGYLFPLVDRTLEGLAGARPVILVGFSQGAYLAYHLALRHPDRFAGVVGIAGRAKPEILGDHLAQARGVRVLHLHGADDRVVSLEACRGSIDTLVAAELDARVEVLPGGHDVSEPMVEAIAGWLGLERNG